ncbi:hypothetical protein PHYBOEH_000995 [Phytophthora boehmeriae]|uniref:Uncharacterized protein n=1 Tax=Phytophthora boehmeriae TaxID=109152 RepID=A0A8T1XDJ2_9STRA|nr:hypothetical protein PHYBOEH_000995 [Phytophthora boehmeriae]
MSRGFAGDESMGHHILAKDDDDDDPGSGDDDVLGSFTAIDRARRALYREKRAHDYTKRRLVEIVKRENMLKKRLAPVGGTVEGIENVLMRLEDSQAIIVAMKERYDVEATEQARKLDENLNRGIVSRNEESLRLELPKCEYLQLEFKELQKQSQTQDSRLREAEAVVLSLKIEYQQVLSELLRASQEKKALVKRLRKARKSAILMATRKCTYPDAPQSLPHIHQHDEHDSKKRSLSDVNIDPESAMI